MDDISRDSFDTVVSMAEGTLWTFESGRRPAEPTGLHYKDEVLDLLARHANVAQFVSFGPDLTQRYCRIFGLKPNHRFHTPAEAVKRLFKASPEETVNVRTYKPEEPKNNDFVGPLTSVVNVLKHLNSFASRGLFTIVNESIDVNDGGVSGVMQGGLVEFAPGDTPRCVEKGDIAALPVRTALKVFRRVYGFDADLKSEPKKRVEFSIHPTRRGFSRRHTIIWEIQETKTHRIDGGIRWPNAFSRHLGDKLFGLVLADALGFATPSTLAITRRLPPFRFGRRTENSSGIKWIRTCPATKSPGKFITVRGWADPFATMKDEDPSNDTIRAIIVQDEVDPKYSGALITSPSGVPVIEGVSGTGEALMQGSRGPTELPTKIRSDVEKLYARIHKILGSIRVEWVHDGRRVWVVQLQQEAAVSSGDIIFASGEEPSGYEEFPTNRGLNSLRKLIASIVGTGKGIVLKGDVGLTSHLADELREARIPSRRVLTYPRRSQIRLRFEGDR